MEGDAGASRLNPTETDDSSSSEVQSEDSGSDVMTSDSEESEVITDEASTEVQGEDSEATAEDEAAEGDAPADEGNPSRLGRRWLIGIAAALLVLAAGIGTGGYFALRFNQESQAIARYEARAIAAAKDCIAATQAPDAEAMAAGAQKIIECSTGDFRSQAVLYSSLFVQAYQVAHVQVQVSDLRAAVERRNADGSFDVLVALRVKTSNSETQNREIGYRLRAKMAPDEGQYRIAKLDQVAK
jgi:Mce-associated membrane protein